MLHITLTDGFLKLLNKIEVFIKLIICQEDKKECLFAIEMITIHIPYILFELSQHSNSFSETQPIFYRHYQ